MKEKCDIIIPIYNSPEWLKLCVYALIKNTPKEFINRIILMNDNSDELTCNCIENLKNKYEKDFNIIVSKNNSNLGFIKNVNKGLDLTESKYVLLLNTDCLISKNTIPKLIEHMKKDEKIALICPISSNAANLSLDIFENYSYMQMNDLLENNFKGMTFDACTVVGNCLMITRECIKKVGYLDEIYGMGYGDETDYQFKAHAKGFEAKVAIDTYVFHKSEVSFGTSPKKQARLEHNRKIFFDRWGKEYEEKMKKYVQNDPIEYINKNLKISKKPAPDILFFLPDIHQNAGGVHIVVDIVNYLNINGIFANILTERLHDYDEIMLFSPSYMNNITAINPKCIVGTIYPTIFFCKTIAEHFNIPFVNFMQGYEPCFDNGEVYKWAELACKNSENILAISEFLKRKCIQNFNKEATVISNGVNIDLLYNNLNERNVNKNKVITFVFRNNFPKGDFILAEILKQITVLENNIDINIVHNNDILFPINNNSSINISFFKGPLPRKEISTILSKSDIFVDASIMEGFGLMALEAMALGNVPVVSESFGIDEYAVNGENAFIIKEINNSEQYIEKIRELLHNENLLLQMKNNAKQTAKKFDIDIKVDEYIKYFKNVKRKEIVLTDIEKAESQRWYVPDKMIFTHKKNNDVVIPKVSFRRRVLRMFLGLFPQKIKVKVKNKLRQLIN